MVDLLSLPNDILMYIYVYSCTIESAVSLYSVSRRLSSVWLKHANYIAEAILKRQIPAYQDAVNLAVLEEPLIDKIRLAIAGDKSGSCSSLPFLTSTRRMPRLKCNGRTGGARRRF